MSQIEFDPEFASPSDYASFYRSLHIQVVPSLAPNKGGQWKLPAVSWKSLQNEIVPDLTFERWYGSSGEHIRRQNMGLITGKASNGIFVVDVDLHRNPEAAAWWQYIIEQAPSLSDLETVAQTTGGGGKQYLFRSPADWLPPTFKTSIGVDIRGQGGFAVLPPSLHESGNRYQWDDGFEPWSVEIADAPHWLCAEIDRLAEKHGGRPITPTGQIQHTASPDYATTAFGQIVDGREDYMTRIIWARIVDLRREAPMISQPELNQAANDLFQIYIRNVKSRIVEHGTSNADLLEREGRGETLFQQKWHIAVKQWDEKVAEHAKVEKPAKEQPQSRPEEPVAVNYRFDAETGEIFVDPLPEGAFPYLDVRQIKTMPDPEYLIDGLVAEKSFGITGGAPGAGKSFITQGQALAIATGQEEWFGRKIYKHGPVVYITNEGLADLKFRIMAWEQHFAVKADDAPFFLIQQSINFMQQSDIMKLLQTVAHIAKLHTSPVAVYVDTVSRVLPGADENLQKDMTIFIAACDAVRQAFNATVIGVHHTSRQGNLRGSTVFEGAADFILMIEREAGDTYGTMTATKIKYAPDGWQNEFEMKVVNTGNITGKESLVAVYSESKPKGEKTQWPDKSVLEKVLREMQKAFDEGKAWAMSRNAHHQAVMNVQRVTGVNQQLARQILEAWQTNAVIEIDCCDKKAKKYGFKVIGSIRD